MHDALGRYKILDRVGAGRMGELFRARDTHAGRTVALRVVAAETANDPGASERLLRDAQAARGLSHPNVAALFDAGADAHGLFLVSEFVPGDTLRTLIDGRSLNVRRALDYGSRLADALAEAHAAGLVHRDVQPGNVIVTSKGVAKFVDVGFADWTASGTARREIGSGATGTLESVGYMSPEQIVGASVDRRTDVFSLGIVLYEMVTGTLPFTGATPPALAVNILQALPEPPGVVADGIPPELDAIILRMLEKEVDKRCEAVTAAAELRSIATLLNIRHGAVDAQPIVTPPRYRGPGIWLLVALIALGLVAALIFLQK